MTEPEPLVFNGLDAVTGGYLTQTTDEELSRIAQGVYEKEQESEHTRELLNRHSQERHSAINADHRNLHETGWGVIFAHNADPRIREALKPLLDHRKEQATRLYEERYQEYIGYDDQKGRGGYLPGESKMDFTVRHGAGGFDSVNPDVMPYYLLIVGDPQTIPYEFQYQLDVQYAVGRIAFDTIEEYARYARSVVDAETKMPPLQRTATFFGVRNEGDVSTETSADHLIKPLVEEVLPGYFAQTIIREQYNADQQRKAGRDALAALNDERIQICTDWQQNLTLRLSEQTYKNDLGHLLGGDQTPALLFTASHGIGFPNGHPLQLTHQGGLVCQDWPGPRYNGEIVPDWYFSADDVSEQARLMGLIAFFFACYGGGTPAYDEFAQARQREIAPYPFLARLPQRLLTHPKGGALAVVAHVERAWGYSFRWERQRQLKVFEDMLTWLMIEGKPVGAAIEWLNGRYAEIAAALSATLEPAYRFNKKIDIQQVARLWTTNNDSRGYVILGDPAVRLLVAGPDKAGQRITIQRESITLTSTTVEVVASSGTDAPGVAAAVAQAATPGSTPPSSSPPPAPLPATPRSVVTSGSDAVEYGLFGDTGLKEAREGLINTLVEVAGKVGQALKAAVDDATSLEVSTYISDSMEGVAYDAATGKFAGTARLRALTRISIDGDTLICLPEKDGQIDTAVWEIHTAMVQRAQENRTELLKTAVSAVTGLLESLKQL